MSRDTRNLQAIRNCIQILSLRDTPVIDQVIGTTNHLITGITCLNKTLCHIAHVDHRYDILARANGKALTRLDQRDKTAKTRRIAWSIDPARTVKSPCTISTPSRLCKRPLSSTGRTTALTSSPRSNNISTRCPPRKPAAPVTSTFTAKLPVYPLFSILQSYLTGV